MARLEYFLRETASGLRRNGIVAFAAMSTAFIALFLFGLSLLIYREFNLVIENLTGNVEVAVYLTDPVNDRRSSISPTRCRSCRRSATSTYETKEEACDNFHRLFRASRGTTRSIAT